ncbi:MAG: integration host factor subunit beta [Prevotella sp.]|nr:integration host factor subunit beta [Prevotella sp.]
MNSLSQRLSLTEATIFVCFILQKHIICGAKIRKIYFFRKKCSEYFHITLKISNFAVQIVNIIPNNKQNTAMTKADIISKIVETTGLPKKDVAATVEAFMSEIRTCMADNKENVYLRGFGTFTIKHRAKKTARNISKNTTLVIDAHDIPSFKPAKSFVERMK